MSKEEKRLIRAPSDQEIIAGVQGKRGRKTRMCARPGEGAPEHEAEEPQARPEEGEVHRIIFQLDRLAAQ